MATQIKLRRDTDANWTTNSTVVLAEGEIGVNLTSGQFKLGDGSSTWAELTYFEPGASSVDLSAVAQDILPAVDSNGTTGYTLGSASFKWKELFVSNGSIYIGDVKLSNVAGKLRAVKVVNPGEENEAEDPDDSDAASEIGAGGSGDTLTNSTQTFSLDEAGNAVFSGDTGGVNRGLVWDYGAESGGENSTVRQDQNGLTVRAYTEVSDGVYSAPVNIVTNEDANEKRWTFDGDGDLTLPAGGDIVDSTGTSVLGGSDGLSAYQVAVNNGFSGTEQQWLDSLVGSTTITNNYPEFTNVLATINKTGGTVGTPTAIDLTQFVNKLSSAADGRYTLADGVEGQLMYLTQQGTSSIQVRVANARVNGNLDTNADLTFTSGVITLLFTDGAWQQSGGEWPA